MPARNHVTPRSDPPFLLAISVLSRIFFLGGQNATGSLQAFFEILTNCIKTQRAGDGFSEPVYNHSISPNEHWVESKPADLTDAPRRTGSRCRSRRRAAGHRSAACRH